MSRHYTDTSGRHAISAEDRTLLEQYYGSQCALTKLDYPPPDFAHVIPHSEYHLAPQQQKITRMKNSGLIPEAMDLGSPKNIIPLSPNFHRAYDGGRWTFFPTEPVLQFYIAFEEWDLIRREAITPTSGRLSYSNSYIHFPPIAEFDAYFTRNIRPFLTYDDEENPIIQRPPQPVPVRELIASVNIVVATIPSMMLDLRQPQARRCLALAGYLRFLWDASSNDFRDLARPVELNFTLEGAEAYVQQRYPGVWANVRDARGGNTTAPQAGNLNNNDVQEVRSGTPKLDHAVSDEECEATNPASDDRSLQLPAEGYILEKDNMGSGRITSNDWAFLKYRTVLGGPVFNF